MHHSSIRAGRQASACAGSIILGAPQEMVGLSPYHERRFSPQLPLSVAVTH